MAPAISNDNPGLACPIIPIRRQHQRGGFAVLAVVLSLVAGLCGGCPGDTSAPAPGGAAHPSSSMTIRGAGATFPYPAYSKWALLYFEKTGLRLKYVKRDSRGGIAAIKAREVDFGASDIPLPVDALSAHELMQFPALVGGVVPVYNLPGLKPGALRLDADLLAGIYLGKIKRWDDPALRRLNPQLRLPGKQIIPIGQPGGSGTTWLVQRFLGLASPVWRAAGKHRRIAGVPATDNSQVARFVLRFKHSLGYVEYSYAVKHRLSWARLRNRSGKFCSPNRKSFGSAVEHGSWSATSPNVATLATAPRPDNWPITGASYILLRRGQEDASKAMQMLRFFYWALTEGTVAARGLDYATIPARHVKTISRAWALQVRAGGRPVWRGPD